MLEESQILLSLQETDLKVREAKLTEEQARDQHSFDVRDLPVELEEHRARVGRIEDECAIKAGKTLKLVMEISNALVDEGKLPIQDIPQLPKLAQEVLAAIELILERLREEQASEADPWD
jgi:hypothetical protein